MSQTDRTYWNWIEPPHLSVSWHPETFHPDYLELERDIETAGESLQRLGDLVQVVRPPTSKRGRGRWFAGLKSITEQASSSGGRDPLAMQLPGEAILVSRVWQDSPSIQYWNERIYRGGGSASSHLWALIRRDSGPIAWLCSELQSRLGLLQIRRASVGGTTPVLPLDSLLEVRVRQLSLDEQEQQSDLVFETTKREVETRRLRDVRKPFLLTAETFDGKLSQFETYLQREGLFSRSDGFFVEAATANRDADMFVVRPLRTEDAVGDQVTTLTGLVPQDEPEVNAAWRKWYWDTSASELARVFDSLPGEHELPPHLLSRMISKSPRFGDALVEVKFPIASFSAFRDAIVLDEEDESVVTELTAISLVEAWAAFLERGDHKRRMGKLGELYGADPDEHVSALAQYVEFALDLLDWLGIVYRPALGLKVLKQDEVAGVYILFGDNQLCSTEDPGAVLEQLGTTLAEILVPSSQLLEDVSRRESSRRLSTIMHEVGRPAGRAKVALDGVVAFLAEHPETAAQLVPNEREARNCALLAEVPLSSYTLSARVEMAQRAVDEIGRIVEQTRRLRRVQADELPRSVVDLETLLQDRIAQAKEGLPGLRVALELAAGIRVSANLETVTFAIDEVLNNSCRELQARHVASPTIWVRSRVHGDRGWFEVSDNGLAAEVDLPKNVFDEWVTTYAAESQGSGLALAIVRETFRRHGGVCTLEENRDDTGHRLPGVTFAASLPLAEADQEKIEDTELV